MIGRLVGWIAKKWAPNLIGHLVAQVDSDALAEHLYPALFWVYERIHVQWQAAFVRKLRILADVATRLAEEAERKKAGGI